MKNFILAIATLVVLTACGKKDEPVVSTAAATTPSCQAGYVWNGSSCVIGQTGSIYPGQPGYTGQPGYQPYYPSYPQMCGGGMPQYPGQYPYCSNWSRYRWYTYGGMYFYYYY